MIFFYISLVTYICFTVIKYRETLFNLEKEKYDSKKYRNFIMENIKYIFLTPESLIFILIIIILNFDLKTIEISTIIAYMILFITKTKSKNNLKINKKTSIRIVLIIAIYIFVNIWFVIDYKSYHESTIIFDNSPVYYIILIMMTYLSYIIIYPVNFIATKIDKFIK